MNLVERYRGVTLRFHHDRITEIYLGHLEGPSFSTNIQAATYEGLVEAFHQAVDARSLATAPGPALAMDVQRETESNTASSATVNEGMLAQDSEDDPYSRRQFLR